jgi:uncharacterized membrane protein YphA (DoxX/SURF4 family)
MKILNNDYLHLAIRLLIGGLFLYAGLPKILDTMGFASSIYNYKLFSSPVIGLTAAFIPWVEVLAGLALVLGVKVRGASLLISLLLVVFVSLTAISAMRGLDIDCGCFSGVERKANWLAIFEDLALLGCSFFIFYFDRLRVSPIALIKKRNNPDKKEALQ